MVRIFEERYSLIRVLHAVPDSDAVDIYINNTLFFKEIRFTQFTPYVYIPEGTHEMEVYNVDTTENPILRGNIEVKNGELATIAMSGNSNDLKLLTIKEDKERPQRGYSKIRVVHLSPNAPEVDILIDGEVLFKDIEFRDISDYVEILAGDYRMDVEAVASQRILRSNRKTINPDRIYTFYALGNLPNVQIFQSLDGSTFITPSISE